MMTHKDSRVKVMSEILGGIRVIKFNSWEKHFARKVDTLRDLELASLKGRKYLDAWCVFFWACTPALISLLTFATYALLGRPLTAARVFTSVALLNILLTPLNAFPWVVNGLVEAWVSVKRLQQFFELGEQQLLRYYTRPLHESGKDASPTGFDCSFVRKMSVTGILYAHFKRLCDVWLPCTNVVLVFSRPDDSDRSRSVRVVGAASALSGTVRDAAGN